MEEATDEAASSIKEGYEVNTREAVVPQRAAERIPAASQSERHKQVTMPSLL
jgi:hypothetical protein